MCLFLQINAEFALVNSSPPSLTEIWPTIEQDVFRVVKEVNNSKLRQYSDEVTGEKEQSEFNFKFLDFDFLPVSS